MTFGEKLQKLRKEKGWTQEELAAQICISRQALSKWEQGMVIPDTENVLQVSKIFGVSTDYLLHDDYENDGDIPAVHASNENLTQSFKAKTARLIGAGISCLGLIGWIVLYTISCYTSITYPSPEGTNHSAIGFGVFISAYRLEWLVGLCTLLLLVGAVVLTASFVRQRRKTAKK